jgi:dihydroorotate dehydrogenase electron transfer subunit
MNKNSPTEFEMTATADCPKFEFVSTRIVRHRQIAKDTWQMTVESESLASRTLPGQFFMVRIAGLNDPLIGRALAMFDMHCDSFGKPSAISVVYTVKGKFTQVRCRG